MKRFINLTPHVVSIYNRDNEVMVRFAPEDVPARCSFQTVVIDDIDGIPVSMNVYSDIKGLLPEREDTCYIVSRMIAERCPNRHDLYVPNDMVRDEMGNPIGCRSLMRL